MCSEAGACSPPTRTVLITLLLLCALVSQPAFLPAMSSTQTHGLVSNQRAVSPVSSAAW